MSVPYHRAVSSTDAANPKPRHAQYFVRDAEPSSVAAGGLLRARSRPPAFVGSARLTDDPDTKRREMRRTLDMEKVWADSIRTWQHATQELRRAIVNLDVMAVINGVVENDKRVAN